MSFGVQEKQPWHERQKENTQTKSRQKLNRQKSYDKGGIRTHAPCETRKPTQ